MGVGRSLIDRRTGAATAPEPPAEVRQQLRRLTEREREVLALVAEGRSNKGVALQLFVTERSIEAHLTQIFAKLGLSGSNLQHRRVLAVATFLRS